MLLQDRLNAFKAELIARQPPNNVPPEVFATMARATAELIDSGAPGLALKAGDLAPAFSLAAPDGTLVASHDLLARGPLIVSFYRGVWCPYCNMELKALQEALPAFQEAGASLVAISPQTQVNSRKSVRDNALTFPILSDPGNAVAAQFGLRFTMPDYLIALYKARKNDLPTANGDASWTLPMPGRFVIGQDSVIRYAEVNPDYTQRPEPLDLLPAIRASQHADS